MCMSSRQAGGEARRIFEESGAFYALDFSSDGKQLLVTHVRSRDDAELYLVELESGRRRRLTPKEWGSLVDAVFPRACIYPRSDPQPDAARPPVALCFRPAGEDRHAQTQRRGSGLSLQACRSRATLPPHRPRVSLGRAGHSPRTQPERTGTGEDRDRCHRNRRQKSIAGVSSPLLRRCRGVIAYGVGLDMGQAEL